MFRVLSAYLLITLFSAHLMALGDENPLKRGRDAASVLAALVFRVITGPREGSLRLAVRTIFREIQQAQNEPATQQVLELQQARMERLQAAYDAYMAYIQANDGDVDAPGPIRVAAMLRDGQAIITTLEGNLHEDNDFAGEGEYYSPENRRGTVVQDAASPTGGRLSGMLNRNDFPELDEDIGRLSDALRRTTDRNARQVENQVTRLHENLRRAEHNEEEIMSLRGAVQTILKILTSGSHYVPAASAVPNNGALLDSDNEEEKNDGDPLSSDED